MKVLLINKFYHVRGGADKYFFETVDVLEKHGHHVIPFSTVHQKNKPTPYAKYFSRFGVTDDDLDSTGLIHKLRLFWNGVYSFEAARQLEHLVRDTKPDIAHVHNIMYQLTPSVFPVLQKYGIPVVQSLHDWYIVCGGAYLYIQGTRCERCKGGHFYQCTLHKCFRNSVVASLMGSLSKYVDTAFGLWKNGVNAFTVPSEQMVKRLSEWGFPASKIHVIHNPMSLENLNPTYEIQDHVVWYGRLLSLKGVYTVLRAAKELRNLRFEMYGSGPEETGVRTFIAEYKLTNVFLDTTTRWGPELQQRIANALCVVEPSEWYSPSQYVIWESFALGKPVLATNIGGTPDMIEQGVNGWMFEPGNHEQLVDAIAHLAENPKLVAEWGKAARAKVEKVIATQNFCDSLMEIYQIAKSQRNGT